MTLTPPKTSNNTIQYHNRKNLKGVKDRSRLQTESCYVCGIKGRLNRHRIIPHGDYSEWNVVILCNTHHSQVHDEINQIPMMFTFEPYWNCVQRVRIEYNKSNFGPNSSTKVKKLPLGIPRQLDIERR